MKRLRNALRRQEGMAMATVVMMIAVLTLLGVVLIDQVTAESNRAARSTVSDSVYQAAEAGVNDYIAKLTDDPQYYDHYVANGESTRAPVAGGTSVSPGGEWTPGVAWTYPSLPAERGKTTWYSGAGSSTRIDGYAYNLMVSPPVAAVGTNPARAYLTVVSTGCRLASGGTTCDSSVLKRTVEVHLKQTTPADFAFMYGRTPTQWGQTATTYGRIYVSGSTYTDASGHTITDPGDICHDGTAYGDLMAEGRVNRTGCYNASNMPPSSSPWTWPTSGNGSTPSVTYGSVNGVLARKYDSTTTPRPSCPSNSSPPCPLKSKVDFSNFSVSLTDVKRAADLNSPTTVFDDPSAGAWRILFSTSGNVKVWKCAIINGKDSAAKPPYCDDLKLASTVTLPKNGTTSTVTVNVNGSTESFPDSTAPAATRFFWIGPRASNGRIDKVTYTGLGTNGTSFTGCKCPSCTTSTQQHIGDSTTGETVSDQSGGRGSNLVYNGPVPTKGAIYTGQDAVVSWPTGIGSSSSDGKSWVNGRVTVASGDNIVVGNDIHYYSENGGAYDDVLGLIAKNNIWVASYTARTSPTLFWRAAVIAQEGMWSVYDVTNHDSSVPPRGTNSVMTFVGSMADATGEGAASYGCSPSSCSTGAAGFAARNYISDDGSYNAPNSPYNALKFLFPPWYPILDTQATVLFREISPGCLISGQGTVSCS